MFSLHSKFRYFISASEWLCMRQDATAWRSSFNLGHQFSLCVLWITRSTGFCKRSKIVKVTISHTLKDVTVGEEGSSSSSSSTRKEGMSSSWFLSKESRIIVYLYYKLGHPAFRQRNTNYRLTNKSWKYIFRDLIPGFRRFRKMAKFLIKHPFKLGSGHIWHTTRKELFYRRFSRLNLVQIMSFPNLRWVCIVSNWSKHQSN